MPKLNDVTPVSRKTIPIIYVLDTSGSMAGDKIAKVNEAMNETFEVLKELLVENVDAEIKINVLKFSSGAEWVYPALVSLEDKYWNDLEACGCADIGGALDELRTKLSRSSMMAELSSCYLPTIIFISDGNFASNWEKALNEINQNNKWFNHATKIAIAIGDDASTEVLAKVVGIYNKNDGTIRPNAAAVIKTYDSGIISKMLKILMAPWIIYRRQAIDGHYVAANEVVKETIENVDNALDENDLWGKPDIWV